MGPLNKSPFFAALVAQDVEFATRVAGQLAIARAELEDNVRDVELVDICAFLEGKLMAHHPNEREVSDLVGRIPDLGDPRMEALTLLAILGLLEENDLGAYVPLLLPVPFRTQEA